MDTHRLLTAMALTVWAALSAATARAEPPSDPITSFATAKRVALKEIYGDQKEELYCACRFKPNATGSGGKISNTECGYRPRKNAERGKRLEWEHIMPAAEFGRDRSCWSDGHRACSDAKGSFRGRRCCVKVDKEFQRMEADLHNLAPAVGELNGDRSDKPYGLIRGGEPQYGRCEFKVDFTKELAEPRKSIRGFVARVWLYMSETYEVTLDPKVKAMLEGWSDNDPPDRWERERDERIAAHQGNRNPFIAQASRR